MKIAIVVDSLSSALGIAASSRARIRSSITVIEGLEFITPGSLLRHFERGGFDLVLFSWRFLAYDLFLFGYLTSVIQRISSTTSFAVLIPDHLGNRMTLVDKERSLLDAIDYFLVTNESLLAYYKRDYPEKCKGMLHDMPDVDAIEKVSESKLDAGLGAIWVGNSKWGKKKGIEDHKRMYELVYPLIKEGIDIEIIDSAVNRKQNTDVLNRIVKRKFLIQTSKEEGTGLPILEACALGVIPITTDVGVANELLRGKLNSLIVDPNVVDFIAAMEWADNNSHLPHELKDRFARYIQLAKQEELFFETKKSSHRIKSSFSVQFMTLAIWVIRSIRYRFKQLFSRVQ